MGKTIRRYDRDDDFHDVRWEKEKSSRMRNERIHRRDIDETTKSEEPTTYKKAHSKNRTHTMFDFYKGK